jgi:hypothetical protein
MQPLNNKERTILLTKLGVKNADGLNAGRTKYIRTKPHVPNGLTTTKPSRTHARGVQCVETGEVFPSIVAAAKAHGVKPSNLSDHLKGRGYTVGGRKYEYAPDAPDASSAQKRDTTKRPIRCIDTGEVFQSLTQTAKAHGISTNGLSLHLRGIQSNVGGKKYEYTSQ